MVEYCALKGFTFQIRFCISQLLQFQYKFIICVYILTMSFHGNFLYNNKRTLDSHVWCIEKEFLGTLASHSFFPLVFAYVFCSHYIIAVSMLRKFTRV
jgi:hypothetical protein